MDGADGSNSGLIAAYLDAVIRKDAAVVDRYFDPNVDIWSMERWRRSGWHRYRRFRPMSRARFHGWESTAAGRLLKAFLAHMHRNLEVTAFGPREVISRRRQGGRIRMVPAPRLVDRPDRGHFLFDLFELRDGLIVKYHFLENTFDVAAAFRCGGSWLIATDGAERHVPSTPGASEIPKCPLRIPPRVPIDSTVHLERSRGVVKLILDQRRVGRRSFRRFPCSAARPLSSPR